MSSTESLSFQHRSAVVWVFLNFSKTDKIFHCCLFFWLQGEWVNEHFCNIKCLKWTLQKVCICKERWWDYCIRFSLILCRLCGVVPFWLGSGDCWCHWLDNTDVDAALKAQECGFWGGFLQLIKHHCRTHRLLDCPKEGFIILLLSFCSPLQPPLRNMESIFHGERDALGWAVGDTTLLMDFSITGPSELQEVSRMDWNAIWEQTFWSILWKNSAEYKYFPKMHLFKTSCKKLVLFSSLMLCAQALWGFCGSCICLV